MIYTMSMYLVSPANASKCNRKLQKLASIVYCSVYIHSISIQQAKSNQYVWQAKWTLVCVYKALQTLLHMYKTKWTLLSMNNIKRTLLGTGKHQPIGLIYSAQPCELCELTFLCKIVYNSINVYFIFDSYLDYVPHI